MAFTEPSTVIHATGGLTVAGPAVIHKPGPISFSESNCEEVVGISTKAVRQLLRRGLRSVETRDGRVILVADYVEFIRERGDVLPADPAKPKPEDGDRALLRGAGVKLHAVRGGR